MNGFLVVLRHSMDDIPLFLTSGIVDAQDFAAKVTPDSGEPEQQVIGSDASTPICVWIYTFEHGRLVAAEKVKEFDDVASEST